VVFVAVAIEATIKKREPQVVAFISMKGPYSLIGEAFGKLRIWIGEQGYIPAIPPVGVYLNSPKKVLPEELLWELQIAVVGDADPTEPDEQGCGFKQLDEATLATAEHQGAYDQVPARFGALRQWIAENGYEIVGPPEEAYLSKIEDAPPQDLFTEVRFPVIKR
jgi:effector-binding domain-containing protein